MPNPSLAFTADQADMSAAPPAAPHQLPSTGPGQDMVRSLALMLMAAIMAVLVMLTDRLLLDRVGVGHVLSWLVMWSVLLSALMALSRLAMYLSHALLAWLDRASLRAAQAKSSARRATLTP